MFPCDVQYSSMQTVPRGKPGIPPSLASICLHVYMVSRRCLGVSHTCLRDVSACLHVSRRCLHVSRRVSMVSHVSRCLRVSPHVSEVSRHVSEVSPRCLRVSPRCHKVSRRVNIGSTRRHVDIYRRGWGGQNRKRPPEPLLILYRYLCGIYHFFDSFLKWYGSAKCGMVLV